MPLAPDPLESLLPPFLQPDPFTAGYHAIRNGLLSYRPFQRAIVGQQAETSLVNDPNALSAAASAHFSDSSEANFQYFDPQIQTADLPKYEMYQTPFTLEGWGPSAALATIEQNYDLVAITETLNVVPMNRLKFAAFIGLRRLGPTLGLGEDNVRDWKIINPMDNPGSLKEWTRGKIAYVSMLRVQVSFYLDRSLADSLGRSQ